VLWELGVVSVLFSLNGCVSRWVVVNVTHITYHDPEQETRRAMVKSYQTSGGTVLSTNWDEVSKKDYEKEGIQAPKGQVAKKWGQD
jgi:hypothetical protein